MPFIQGLGDNLTQPLYDEQNVLAAGTTQLVFFSSPVGAGTKTFLNTNMQLAGQLQAGFAMSVRAVAISFRTGALLANIKAILDTGFGQFNISSKWWLQTPLRFLPGGVGISGFSDLGAATPLNAAWSNGAPDPRGMYTLIQPIDITATESFNYTASWQVAPVVTVDTPMTTALHGVLTRTVQ